MTPRDTMNQTDGPSVRTRARKFRWPAPAGMCLVALMTACAPQQADTSVADENLDPAVVGAMEQETQDKPLVFVAVPYMENALQAHMMADIVNRTGGEAEVKELDYATFWPAIAKADNMITMDTWRWQNEDSWQEFVVEQESIVPVGTTDYAGEEGWYVPTYVIKGDPERGIEPMCPGLPDWEALNDCVDVFKTAESEPKGAYMMGAESWVPWYGDAERIKNLGLDYDIVFAGSEAALFAELTRAYEQGKPWLGLMWRPNYMTFKYDVTRIEFPPHTEACWGATYACQWPETTIYRIASDDVESKYPTAWQMMQNYDLDGDQLKSMQALVVDEGLSIEEAAQTWVDENPEVWQGWLT